MTVRWELMFRTVGVAIDAETAMADYTHDENARLVKIRVDPGGIAATSLIESGHIRVTSQNQTTVCPFHGIGLETVPRHTKKFCDINCELPVKGGIPIKGWYYHNVLPVTPEITVYGKFVS